MDLSEYEHILNTYYGHKRKQTNERVESGYNR